MLTSILDRIVSAAALVVLSALSTSAGSGCAVVAGRMPMGSGPGGNLAPLPSPRHGHRAERIGGRVVVFGGYDARSTAEDRGARETWIFSLMLGSWHRGADTHLDHAFCASAVVEDSVWAIGDDVERYDVYTDR